MLTKLPQSHALFRFLAVLFFLHACLMIHAQDLQGGDEKVTINGKNIPLRDVFKSITRQTGLHFFYSPEVVNPYEKVTVDVRQQSVDNVLSSLLANKGLAWVYNDNAIAIREKEQKTEKKRVSSSESDSLTNPVMLTGKITDAAGNPIPGATVRIKRTNDGATTDEEGNFILPKTRPNEKIIISSIGYETREITVDGKSLMVKLNVIVNDLDETVIKGYYNTTKRLNTGNISSVKAEDIAKQPISDPIAALQGRVPGLFVQQQSGAPGASFTVRLRGLNSMSNGNNPLYIVDGVPFSANSLSTNFLANGAVQFQSPFNSLNPNDIESIDILKDADATAIYGSRGANGVILITTKKGKVGQSKVDINVYAGTGKVTRKLDLLNTQEYLAMRHEALANDGMGVGPTDYDLNGQWDTTRYTDWQKTFIGGTAMITNAQVSLSGGNAQTQFTVGGGYRKETTVFPGNYFDKKISTHIGLNHTSANKKFKANISGNYVSDNNQLPTSDFTAYITLAPNAPPVYDENKNLNWQNNTWYNPFALLNQRSKAITENILGSIQLSYNLLPGLHLKGNIGYNKRHMAQNILSPSTSFPPQYSMLSFIRSNKIANTTDKSWIIEPQISYEKNVGKGRIEVMVGNTMQESILESLVQEASDFSNDALLENIQAAASISTLNYDYSQYRYSALYGRIGLTWNEKYIVNLTARRDGSSRFGQGRQFGNFGAVGAAWIFSREHWIEHTMPFLSFGKLRASYGSTGNDQLSDYQYLSTYTSLSYSYQGLNGLYPTRLTNQEFGWEQVTKLEAALELGFLKDKILANISWYRNRTGNQLVGYPLPSTTGFSLIQYNLPAVVQNTGIELGLNTINFRRKDFHWSSSFNISFPRNKLISYPNIEGSPFATTYTVGKSMFVSNRFHYTGIDPKDGLYTFEDKNGDGNYTYESDREYVFVGQDFTGGLQNNLSFRNWELSILLQFVKQKRQNYYYNFLPGAFANGRGNQPRSVLNRWQKEGDGTALLQKYTTIYRSENGLFDFSDARIGNASFARVENVSLSWQAPSRWVQAMRIATLRLYIQCQNLLTFTKYLGTDPENGGDLSLPPLRMLTAGVQLSL